MTLRILTEETIESLKMRGYLKKNIDNLDNKYDILKNLQKYNVSPVPYLLMFNSLDQNGLKNLMRFICLNWMNLCDSLKDEHIIFSEKSADEICEFFMNDNHKHRIYFFIEIIYQYFFP
tara:strand:- start:32 stop:388 length:357 start_codon:yes stop_codon:yes gene_type:complete